MKIIIKEPHLIFLYGQPLFHIAEYISECIIQQISFLELFLVFYPDTYFTNLSYILENLNHFFKRSENFDLNLLILGTETFHM